MLRIAIRYMGREKDDTLVTSVADDVATRFRAELTEVKDPSPFVILETQDKAILIRRESIISVTIARDDRER